MLAPLAAKMPDHAQPDVSDSPFDDEIATLRAAKDTVQLKYKQPVPYDLVSRIAVARAEKLDR